jgi:hypothetical protein
MNWLMLGWKALTRLPLEKMLVKRTDPVESINRLEQMLKEKSPASTSPSPEMRSRGELNKESAKTVVEAQAPSKVTTEETIAYQKREIGKELLLLEKHLQQRCKIAGKACDCCEKHPLAIEALAQEALGMTGAELYNELVSWARGIMPITTEAASASGEFNERYPQLSVEARALRKRLMGTEEVKALLSPELDERVLADVQEILDRAFKEEGGNDEREA